MTIKDETAVDALTTAPLPKKGVGFLILFGLLNLGLYLTIMMPALFSLPYKVQIFAPDNKATLLGVVVAIGAVISIVVGPAAGVLSDRTRTRWGRRRPWLIGGIVVLLAGAVIVAVSDSVPMLILGWIIVCIGQQGPIVAITPVMAEQVPEAQRGSVGAIIGVATQLGGVLGYTIGGMLTGNMVLLFALPIMAFAVVAVIYAIVVPEKVTALPTTSLRETFRLMVFNPRKHPDFSRVWIGKLTMQISLTFLSTFQLYFLADRLNFTPEEAGQKLTLVGGLGIVVTMTFAIASGILSDRFRRRKVFIYTAAVMSATGLTLMAFADGFGLFLAAVLCILGSAGLFGAVDVAMASDLVPDVEQAGRWMSIYNLAASLPSAIAPLLGSALLTLNSTDGTNYTALFLAGAGFALATGVITTFVKGVR